MSADSQKMKNKNSWRRDTLHHSQNDMPKTDNSIDCPCGGYYAKKNKSRHLKTKLHQAYEEQKVCVHCGERATMEDDECPLCHMYQDLHRCPLCDAMTREGEECDHYCDIHDDIQLLHDGNGGYYCDICDEEQGL